MTDQRGRPTVSTYFNSKGMTEEQIRIEEEKILSVVGREEWTRSYAEGGIIGFTWPCDLKEVCALCDRLKQAKLPASHSTTGSRTK